MNKMNYWKKSLIIVFVIACILSMSTSYFSWISNKTNEKLVSVTDNYNTAIEDLNATKHKLNETKAKLNDEIKKSKKFEQELDAVSNELEITKERIETMYSRNLVHNGWPTYWREVNLEQWEIDFFAKLLYCEAGSMGYEGQFWVASAILNLSEKKQMSIWDMGHKVNIFSVAPYVDNAKPTQTQYDIIEEVLSYGWIANVAYFRTDYPHSFGHFMIKIENVCFNSP